MRVAFLSIFFYFFLFQNSLYSKEKNRNNTWCIGFDPGIVFNFSNNFRVDTIKYNSAGSVGFVFTFGLANISNLHGEFILATNSFIAYNSEGNGIENFEDINCPFGTKLREKYGYDGFFNQMSIILPKSGNQYYIFTTGMSDFAFDQWQSPNANYDSFRFDNLNYAVVDMDANNGQGKVIEKNKVLLQNEYLSHNRMTAVKHANGRDWWLVKPHKTKQKFYSFLIEADNIKEPIISDINEFPEMSTGISGQSTFNASGTQMAYTTADYKAEYYIANFDRCSGLFTAFKHFTIPNDLLKYGDDWCEGVAFSSNDSLLYVTTSYSIWQIDLYSNSNNYTKISDPDTILDYFPRYSMIALAPNGKIYIGNSNGTNKSMGFIDSPNIKGLGCNFKGRGNGAISQPYTNLLVPPNMPNYGLGALVGSACDTIRAQPKNWFLYPNPAQESIKLKVPNSSNKTTIEIGVYNMLGQLVTKNNYPINFEHEATINTSSFATGLYILKAEYGSEHYINKFVKR